MAIKMTALPLMIKNKIMEKKMEKEFLAHWAEVGPKYLPELEAWGNSKAVKAKKAFEKNVIMKSKKMATLKKEMAEVWEDAVTMTKEKKWGKAMTKDGVYEWVDNAAAADLLEDIYDVKEALKALIESKMTKINMKLGEKTLENDHFQKIWAMFQEDEDFKGLDGMMKKLCTMVKKV
jgi:hypothetical protein